MNFSSRVYWKAKTPSCRKRERRPKRVRESGEGDISGVRRVLLEREREKERERKRERDRRPKRVRESGEGDISGVRRVLLEREREREREGDISGVRRVLLERETERERDRLQQTCLTLYKRTAAENSFIFATTTQIQRSTKANVRVSRTTQASVIFVLWESNATGMSLSWRRETGVQGNSSALWTIQTTRS